VQPEGSLDEKAIASSFWPKNALKWGRSENST